MREQIWKNSKDYVIPISFESVLVVFKGSKMEEQSWWLFGNHDVILTSYDERRESAHCSNFIMFVLTRVK